MPWDSVEDLKINKLQVADELKVNQLQVAGFLLNLGQKATRARSTFNLQPSTPSPSTLD
ncbi:hypothetical protein [Moorena sp. SIO4G3]|uniref:hypothetical protein n=1 Tax=Moorena sp. SIO4G3 TaxID=2607821 RepID=UPI00142B38C0|nr:hypothetical protein [Moorena sp. SIO4G3]NEO76032.1 hypothetical protein [Moorena sp. SIO4G3]